MSIPAYLDSSVYPFSYTEVFNLTDVETGGVGIISSMRSLLVNATLNWTEPSTALFKTPVDAAGRFLDVLVTRITATTVEWRVRNQVATTVCTRRFNLTSGGSLRLYGSTVGILAEFTSGAENGNELGNAFVLDMAPNLNSDHTLYVVGGAFRNTSGTNDGAFDSFGEFFAVDNGTAATSNRGLYWQATNGATPPMISAAGRFIFREAPCTINFGGTFKWAGRPAHMLTCDSNFNGGDERKIYIDTSTIATFKTIGTSVVATMRYMMRKS